MIQGLKNIFVCSKISMPSVIRTRKNSFLHLWKLSVVKPKFVIVRRHLTIQFNPFKSLEKSSRFYIQIAVLFFGCWILIEQKLSSDSTQNLQLNVSATSVINRHKSIANHNFLFNFPLSTTLELNKLSSKNRVMKREECRRPPYLDDLHLSRLFYPFKTIWQRINTARHQQSSINRQVSHRDYRCG